MTSSQLTRYPGAIRSKAIVDLAMSPTTRLLLPEAKESVEAGVVVRSAE